MSILKRKLTNYSYYILVLAAVLVALSGCIQEEKSEKLKQKLQSALDKQAEIQSYHFSGSMDLNLGGLPQPKQNEPLTAAFMALIKESKLEWYGKASYESPRMEAKLSLLPKGASQPIIAPALIHEQKLYFQIPIINLNPDEYYFIDIPEQNQSQLKIAPHLTSYIVSALLERMDPKAFTSLGSNQDQDTTETIILKITNDNKEMASVAIQEGLSKLMDALLNPGSAMPSGGAEQKTGSSPKGETNMNFQVLAPGEITFVLNEEGYIQKLSFDLQVQALSGERLTGSHHIHFTQTIDNINKKVEFTQNIPTQTRSFHDVLQLLK